MSFIKKNFVLILVFLISLCLNFHYVDWSNIPSYTPDSYVYVEIAETILKPNFPDLSIRSPIFPLVLTIPCLIGDLSIIVYIHIFIASLSYVFLYLIFYRISKDKIFSFFSVVFINMDYSITQFNSVVLTESLSVSVLIILTYLHLAQIDHNQSKKYLFYLIFIDAIAILLKPSLSPIPFAFLIIQIILTKNKYIKSVNKKIAMKVLAIALIFDFSLVFTQCSINFVKKDMFAISDVFQINMLGKIMNFGYLDKQYSQNPELLSSTTALYHEINNPTSPFPLLDKMTSLGLIYENYTPFLKDMNTYLIKQNFFSFFLNNMLLVKNNFTVHRDYYSWISSYEKTSQFFLKTEYIFNRLNSYKFISFLFCFGILIYQIIKKNKDRALNLGFVLLAILSTLFIVSWFSFNEFSRLKINVEPFMDFTVFYSFYFIVLQIKKYLEI